MSQVRTFFRHCPACRRRFEIRLVSKEPGGSESFKGKDTSQKTSMIVSGWPPLGSLSTPPSIVEENIPLIVDVNAFQYLYRCKHCGHQWQEVHESDKVAKEPKGYTGD